MTSVVPLTSVVMGSNVLTATSVVTLPSVVTLSNVFFPHKKWITYNTLDDYKFTNTNY